MYKELWVDGKQSGAVLPSWMLGQAKQEKSPPHKPLCKKEERTRTGSHMGEGFPAKEKRSLGSFRGRAGYKGTHY